MRWAADTHASAAFAKEDSTRIVKATPELPLEIVPLQDRSNDALV